MGDVTALASNGLGRREEGGGATRGPGGCSERVGSAGLGEGEEGEEGERLREARGCVSWGAEGALG